MRTKSSVKEPTRIGSFGTASCSSVEADRPCSSSFDLISPSVSFVAITRSQSTWRSRYGSPPTWSSCPCVSTTALTRLPSR